MQDIRPACAGGRPALCFLRCGGNSAVSSTFFSRFSIRYPTLETVRRDWKSINSGAHPLSSDGSYLTILNDINQSCGYELSWQRAAMRRVNKVIARQEHQGAVPILLLIGDWKWTSKS